MRWRLSQLLWTSCFLLQLLTAVRYLRINDTRLSYFFIEIDASVRKAVLSSLTENLDHQLAQGDYIRLLFLALHDEVVENRILAMVILGRVTNHNPAHVTPPLKRMLVQLLTELKYSITV